MLPTSPIHDIRFEHGASTPSHFKRGALVQAAGRPGLLGRVTCGALSLTDPAGDEGALLLALPGDLIGIDALTGDAVRWQARAVVGSRVEWLGLIRADQWRSLLLQALVVRQTSQAQLARLRRGSVPERVRQLLLTLSGAGGESEHELLRSEGDDRPEGCIPCELPSLQDMALIVDTSPETVSRVLSSLRRQGQLLTRPGRQALLSPALYGADWMKSEGMTRSRISSIEPARCRAA